MYIGMLHTASRRIGPLYVHCVLILLVHRVGSLYPQLPHRIVLLHMHCVTIGPAHMIGPLYVNFVPVYIDSLCPLDWSFVLA